MSRGNADRNGGHPETLLGSLKQLRDPRLRVVFVLGMASGYPWVLIGSAMSAWLAEVGISRTAIGFVGAVTAAYALNFLWAPVVDWLRLPVLGRLGRRRSWILLMQGLLCLATLGISRVDPASSLEATGLLMLCIAFLSATQDVSVDAYRVELFARGEQGKISHGAAMATAGWWTGYGLLGALPFLVVDSLAGGWNVVYIGLAAVWVPFMAFVLRIEPPPEAGPSPEVPVVKHWARRLASTVIEPFAEFLRRNGWRLALGIVAFVLLFKIGEAFLGRMSIVFYKEVGFSNTEIGMYSKVVNWWVTVLFAIAGSLVNARFGILRGLIVGGLAMAATNLMFSWLAVAGPEPVLFVATVVVDGFTAALGTVAFMSFITFLTSHSFTATQYALLASIGNLGRTTLSSSSGAVVDALGGNWALFFVLTAVAVLPSLALLGWLGPKLRKRYPGAFQREKEPE